MAFVIWFQVVIEEEASAGLLASAASTVGLSLPLKVSNDPYSGAFILDADIVVKMKPGDSADTFEITLINLPTSVVEQLQSKKTEGLAKKKPLTAKIHLGYFDEPKTRSQTVMEGAVTSIRNAVGGDGLSRTTISGQEAAGYKLHTTCARDTKPSLATADAFLRDLSQAAGVAPPEGPPVTTPLTDFTLTGESGLEALRKLAGHCRVPLVVRDGKIFMGSVVGTEPAPVAFSEDANIVRLDQLQEIAEEPESCEKRDGGRLKTRPRARIEMTVLGHPGLRVGQTAELKTEKAPQKRCGSTTWSTTSPRGPGTRATSCWWGLSRASWPTRPAVRTNS